MSRTVLKSSVILPSLTMLMLSVSMMAAIPTSPVEGEEGEVIVDEGPGTRSSIAPDFDVQFILDPDEDPLSGFTGEKWVSLEPGMVARYWVLITNLGDHNDTYHVSLNASDKEHGAQWYFLDQGANEIEVELTSPGMRDLYGGTSFSVLAVQIEIGPDATSYPYLEMTVEAMSEAHIAEMGADAPVDTDKVDIVIGQPGWIGLPTWDDTIFHLDPGEWLTLPLTMSNLGNKDIIDVTITIDEDDFWRFSYRDFEDLYERKGYLLDFEWTEWNVSIEQGHSLTKDIKVRVPSEIFGGDDVFQFRALGRIKGFNGWVISDVVTLIVDRYTKLEASLPEGSLIEVVPGKGNLTELRIENTYHTTDFIEDVHLLDPNGVELKVFNETMAGFSGSEVRGGSTVSLFFDPIIGNDIPPGVLDLQLVVDAKYFDPILLNLSIDVKANVSLELLPTDTMVSGDVMFMPGEEKCLVFGVRNSGNSEIGMTLALDSTESGRSLEDAGWSLMSEWISKTREPAYFTEYLIEQNIVTTDDLEEDIGYLIRDGLVGPDVPFSIDHDDTIWIGYDVKGPSWNSGKIVGPIHVKASLVRYAALDPLENITYDEFPMVFHVIYPDLVFDGPLGIKDEEGDPVIEAKEGQRIFFSVNVTNIGEGSSDRALVRVLADSSIVTELMIKPLAPNETFVLTCDITAVSGMNELKLEMDPENEVIESDDQFMEGSSPDANVISTPLSVKEEEEGGAIWIIASVMALSMMTLIILLVVCYLFLRKRKEKANGPAAPLNDPPQGP